MSRKKLVSAVALIITSIAVLSGCGANGIKDLNNYIEDGNNAAAKELVDKGVNLNYTGMALSNTAVFILTQGEGIEETPLSTACSAGNVEMIEYLLDNGADASITRSFDEYPLVIYLDEHYSESIDVVEELIDAGAYVNKGLYMTPVNALMQHYSSADSYYRNICKQELEILLNNGAEWSDTSHSSSRLYKYSGWSVIHFVAACDDYEFLVELLSCDEGRDLINSQTTDDGYTPLHLAAINGQYSNYYYLIEVGADQTIKDRFGKLASDYLY